MINKNNQNTKVENVTAMTKEYVRLNAHEELMSELEFPTEKGNFNWDNITHEDTQAERYFKQNIFIAVFKNRFFWILLAYLVVFFLVVRFANSMLGF